MIIQSSDTTKKTILFFFSICFITYIQARSPFRKPDPSIPMITVSWEHDKNSYILRDSHLEEYSIFKTFDEKFFFEHELPQQPITYRNNPKKSVSGAKLQKLVDELIDEILAGKKVFKHFTVLRARDFNRAECIGLMVLKFKNYPFVVKIFMENPQSLTSPYSKGLVPLFSFYMGGGINRHLVGFTRIKNLEYIKTKLATDNYWSQLVDTPRKWFLLPRQNRWIKIVGTNIGSQKTITTQLPGTYCIIADAIASEKKTSMLNKDDNHTCLSLCRFLDFSIDPHIDNFMWEKDTEKLVIVDTEHFPTFMGFREIQHFDSYLEWLAHLSGKCLNDIFFRSKKDRQLLQISPRVML